MLARSMRADLGVMISASHNPYDDNGIKLFGPDGFKLNDEVETQDRELLDSDLSHQLAKSDDLGRAKRIDGVQDRYIEFAKRTLPRELDLSGLRVVIDCANGAAYKVAPDALWELGADVIAIGVEPDGFNINKDCGSTDLGAITRKVREMRADIGIALDGDADRVMIIDELGHVVDGDQLLAVIAESWKADGRLSRPGVVATVMSNLGLERYLQSIDLELVRTPVGDRYVLERMRADGYNIGGEQSGHIILSDYTDHRRRLCRRAADAGGGQAPQQAGVGNLPPLRAAAADFKERALQDRQADGIERGHQRDRQRRKETRGRRPFAGAPVRHRAGDPRHGRRRRQAAGRAGGG